MNLIKISFELCILIMQICLLLPNVYGTPQLDLPPININTKAKPEIYHNSYTVKIDTSDDKNADSRGGHSDGGGSDRGANKDLNKLGDASDYDRDRSLRYGPPYYDNTDRFYSGHNNNRSYFSNDSQRINDDNDKYYANRDIPEDRNQDFSPFNNNNNYNNYNNNDQFNNNNYRNGYQYGRVNLIFRF